MLLIVKNLQLHMRGLIVINRPAFCPSPLSSSFSLVLSHEWPRSGQANGRGQGKWPRYSNFFQNKQPYFSLLEIKCEPRLSSGPDRGQASVEPTNQNESRINSRFTRDGVSLVAAVGPLTLSLGWTLLFTLLYSRLSLDSRFRPA